jgi:hypothetical protein
MGDRLCARSRPLGRQPMSQGGNTNALTCPIIRGTGARDRSRSASRGAEYKIIPSASLFHRPRTRSRPSRSAPHMTHRYNNKKVIIQPASQSASRRRFGQSLKADAKASDAASQIRLWTELAKSCIFGFK